MISREIVVRAADMLALGEKVFGHGPCGRIPLLTQLGLAPEVIVCAQRRSVLLFHDPGAPAVSIVTELRSIRARGYRDKSVGTIPLVTVRVGRSADVRQVPVEIVLQGLRSAAVCDDELVTIA